MNLKFEVFELTVSSSYVRVSNLPPLPSPIFVSCWISAWCVKKVNSGIDATLLATFDVTQYKNLQNS